MANKKVSQLVSKPSVLVTDLFPIADPTTGQLFKTTISDLGTAIGSGVSSVNTLVGAVVLDTDDIQELASPTNRWFTDTRARAAISGGTGISYNSGTGVITNAVTSGQIATALGYTPANGANYLALAGGTMGGAITGTIATFASSTSVTALGITLSGATGDGVKITHSAGRAFNIQSSGSGFGILINNETASTSAPFTIQKQGLAVITLTDAGAGSFASSLTANSFVKTSGTSSQFLKADGSVDSTSYVSGSGTTNFLPRWSSSGVLTDSAISYNGTKTTVDAQGLISGNGLELQGNYNSVNGQKLLSNDSTTGYSYMEFTNTGGGFRLGVNRNTAGGILSGSATYATFLTTTGSTSLQFGSNGAMILSLNPSGLARFSNQVQIDNTVTATQFIRTSGTSSQFLKADGSVDSSVYLTTGTASSTYLPLSGGTLTGALSGTSASFSSNIIATQFRSNTDNIQAVYMNRSATNKYIGIQYATASVAQWFAGLRENLTSNNYIIYNEQTDIDVLTLNSSTGGATFSSSVTAGAIISTGVSTFSRTGLVFTLNPSYGGGNVYTQLQSTGALALASGGDNNRLYITSSGNVGIGTTAPSGRLSIANSACVVDITSTTSTQFNALEFKNGGGSFYIGQDNSGGGFYGGSAYGGSAYAGSIYTSGAIPIIMFTNATERMRITSGGELYWNITDTTAAALNPGGIAFRNNSGKYIQISTGLTTDASLLIFYKSNGAGGVTNTGSISTSGNLTLYNTTSDYRLKQDFKSYIGLDIINKIKTYDYQWKSDNTRSFGVIAHELQEVLPFAVFGKKDGEQLQQVDYSKIVPVMVQAIKELKAELDTLKNK